MAKKKASDGITPTNAEWKGIISLFQGDDRRNNPLIRLYLEEMKCYGSVDFIRASALQDEINSILSSKRMCFLVEPFSPKGEIRYHLRMARQ